MSFPIGQRIKFAVCLLFVIMNGNEFSIHFFLETTMSEWGYSHHSCFVRVFGFVQAAESALAWGLFGNVVGPVKEFTD